METGSAREQTNTATETEHFEPKREVTEIEKVNLELIRLKEKLKDFSGEIYTFVYRPHPQGFANYAIVKLKISEGIVDEVLEISDYYNWTEARARMEIKQAYLIEKMKTNYPAGYRHV